MKNLFIVTIVLLLISTISIGQLKQLDFIEKKDKTKDEQGENIRVVYFDLKNIDSKTKENTISKLLMSDQKIHNFSIKDFSKCYAVIEKDVDPLYVREIIKPYNIDFDYTTIIVNDLRAITDDLPDDYPSFVNKNRGNEDWKQYYEAIKSWKKDNIIAWHSVMYK